MDEPCGKVDPLDPVPVNRRGRPRLPEPGVSVKTWLRVSEYDRLIELANSRRMKVSTLVRFLLLIDIEPR